MMLSKIMKMEWSVEIGYDDFSEVEDYWFILQNGERVLGTNTPNETMARKWLSIALSPEEVEKIVSNAKKAAGWIFLEVKN